MAKKSEFGKFERLVNPWTHPGILWTVQGGHCKITVSWCQCNDDSDAYGLD